MGKLENKAMGCLLTPIAILLTLFIIGISTQPEPIPIIPETESNIYGRKQIIVPDRPHLKIDPDSVTQMDRIEDALNDLNTR